jgi:hypothetical protein
VANEPATKRAVVFSDGQNPYHGAKEAFGYTYSDFNPVELAKAVCAEKGWQLTQVRFYTGESSS